MMRVVVLVALLAVCLGCGRSSDNGAGFDQAVQDMKHGVKPPKEVPSEEYQKGYREAVDAIEEGIHRKETQAADQKRAQAIHERVPRKTRLPMTDRLQLRVPPYVGHRPSCTDYAAPHVPLVAYEDRGLRVVLGSHDPDELKPDVQIERRPNGWAIFLHPLGGSDPCALVYFHDDGRSWLTKELPGPTPELIDSDDLPAEIDA